jgi:cystathionine beta-lyase
MPCFMSHASIPAEVRAARGLPDDLVRISVGIEDADDLIADLEQAFQKAAAAAAAGAAPAEEQPAAAAGQA